jgi:arsenite methyltransferase
MPLCKRSAGSRWWVVWFLATAVACAAVAATALASAAGDEPPVDLQDLERQFSLARDSKDYDKALVIAEQISDSLFEKHVYALYNVAAMHCLLGHTEKAYVWLQRALDAGFWDQRGLLTDENFASIREEERFKTMVKKARIKQYIEMLERPEREEFQKPEQVMAALAFKPGERVADVGAGSGYFTIPVAKAVGPTGTVWAVDIRQEMLDYIAPRLETENLQNVKLVLAPKDDPTLPRGAVDTILMVDTWHYIRSPEYAKKLRAALAPGGRVVIIDYKPKPWEERPWGPTPEQQTPREELDAHFAQAGLRPIKVHDFLPEQYFVEYGAE